MSGLAHIPFWRMGGLIPALSFAWPGMLWFLLLVPLLVAGYIYLITRRKRFGASLSKPGTHQGGRT